MANDGQIKVVLAGITGWTGEAVGRAILGSDEFKLVGAVARKKAGADAGTVLGCPAAGLPICATLEEALAGASGGVDVFIDYTSAVSVKEHVMSAVARGIGTIVGSSGLTTADFAEIETLARGKNCGVIACGNFAITAALAKHFAMIAARYLPHREIFDYAPGEKIDAPSGTARELADALAGVKANTLRRPIEQVVGDKAARGAQINGTPVHSVRLPGYVFSFETVFGLPDERLSIRHDSGKGAGPYVDGTLLAARRVGEVKGLVRGLDTLLFGE